MARHWHRLPREVMDAPSLETLKNRLDRAVSTLNVPLFIARELDQTAFQGPFQHKRFYDSKTCTSDTSPQKEGELRNCFSANAEMSKCKAFSDMQSKIWRVWTHARRMCQSLWSLCSAWSLIPALTYWYIWYILTQCHGLPDSPFRDRFTPAFGVKEEQPGHYSICLVENLAPQTPHRCEYEAKERGSQFLNVSQLRQPFHFCSFLFINTFPTSSCCTEREEPKLVILDSSQL